MIQESRSLDFSAERSELFTPYKLSESKGQTPHLQPPFTPYKLSPSQLTPQGRYPRQSIVQNELQSWPAIAWIMSAEDTQVPTQTTPETTTGNNPEIGGQPENITHQIENVISNAVDVSTRLQAAVASECWRHSMQRLPYHCPRISSLRWKLKWDIRSSLQSCSLIGCFSQYDKQLPGWLAELGLDDNIPKWLMLTFYAPYEFLHRLTVSALTSLLCAFRHFLPLLPSIVSSILWENGQWDPNPYQQD